MLDQPCPSVGWAVWSAFEIRTNWTLDVLLKADPYEDGRLSALSYQYRCHVYLAEPGVNDTTSPSDLTACSWPMK